MNGWIGRSLEAVIPELEAAERKKRPAHEVIVDELEEACKRISLVGSPQVFENLRAGVSVLLKVLEMMVVPAGVRSSVAQELRRIKDAYPLEDLDRGVRRELPESTAEKFARAILIVGPVPKAPAKSGA